ncbi:MAG: hypothetical protein HY811_04025 [Planctomycetes bacterium]|nr:hypothetical protein [Planctomycetota bacterium]
MKYHIWLIMIGGLLLLGAAMLINGQKGTADDNNSKKPAWQYELGKVQLINYHVKLSHQKYDTPVGNPNATEVLTPEVSANPNPEKERRTGEERKAEEAEERQKAVSAEKIVAIKNALFTNAIHASFIDHVFAQHEASIKSSNISIDKVVEAQTKFEQAFKNTVEGLTKQGIYDPNNREHQKIMEEIKKGYDINNPNMILGVIRMKIGDVRVAVSGSVLEEINQKLDKVIEKKGTLAFDDPEVTECWQIIKQATISKSKEAGFSDDEIQAIVAQTESGFKGTIRESNSRGEFLAYIDPIIIEADIGIEPVKFLDDKKAWLVRVGYRNIKVRYWDNLVNLTYDFNNPKHQQAARKLLEDALGKYGNEGSRKAFKGRGDTHPAAQAANYPDLIRVLSHICFINRGFQAEISPDGSRVKIIDLDKVLDEGLKGLPETEATADLKKALLNDALYNLQLFFLPMYAFTYQHNGNFLIYEEKPQNEVKKELKGFTQNKNSLRVVYDKRRGLITEYKENTWRDSMTTDENAIRLIITAPNDASLKGLFTQESYESEVVLTYIK